MKKYLLILPLLFLWSFGYAEWLPELPMDIYGNANVNDWLVEIYSSWDRAVIASVKEWKFWSTKATDQHILLNKFDWELSLKIIYDWKTYDTKITYSDCPKTFVSKICRYDLEIIKDQITTNNPVITENVIKAAEPLITKDTFNPVFKKSNNEVVEVKKNDEVVDETYEAYKFAFSNRITTQDSYAKVDMTWSLTRVAMAKMLSQYAINVLGKKPDTSKYPNFNDVSIELNAMYDNGVVLAYQLWIMWIGIENFRPYDTVTRAEFGTALSRLLYGTKNWNPYYITHLNKLKQEWVISNTNPTLQETRWYVMLMLMRSFNK